MVVREAIRSEWTTKSSGVNELAGAYNGLAAEHEGVRVVEWLNELGITGVLLKYRVPRRGGDFSKHHHALQDLQRAMRIVRARSQEWNIDPQRLGVCGFSAGGHLCATMCTNHDKNAYSPIDDFDTLERRQRVFFRVTDGDERPLHQLLGS